MTGIYKITNKQNGKSYIGQSTDIHGRWNTHKKDAFNIDFYGYNYPLYCAIRKYGLENFTFEVIEECSAESLDEKEIHYISYYNTFPASEGNGYNILPGGKGNYRRLNESQIFEIMGLLKSQIYTYEELSKKYNVCKAVIGFVNRGSRSYNIQGVKYPIVEKYFPKNNPKFDTSKRKKKNNNDTICPLCGSKMNIKSTMCKQCYYQELKNGKISSIRKNEIPSKKEILIQFNNFGYNREKVANYFKISGNLLRKWCNEYDFRPQQKNEIKKLYKEFVLNEITILQYKHRKQIQIIQKDPTTNSIINIFNSRADAEKYLNLNNGKMGFYNALKNGTLYKGYYWERKQ